MQALKQDYLAMVELQVSGPEGLPLTLLPGQPIVDFETWPYDNQLALLCIGHVKKIGGQHRANLTVANGYLQFEAPPEGVVKTGATADAPDTQDMVAMPLTDILDPTSIAKSAMVCAECGVTCKNARGLAMHQAKAHAVRL
jgi:hypothetical protein